MLRIAVPNKGTLSETAADMLREAGYHGRRDLKELIASDPANDVEFFYLRPRDIATYVGSGALDVGITGRDLLIDSASDAEEIEALGFGASTFRFAAPIDAFHHLEQLEGKRLATSYPGLMQQFLAREGVTAKLVHLDGAVESAVRLGVADAVADVVQTGSTLRKQGLEIFGPIILESEAVLIRGTGGTFGTNSTTGTEAIATPAGTTGTTISTPETDRAIEVLLRRLRGVMVARRFVLMDYDLPSHLIEEATAIAGGVESPTVSPLRDPAWVAVRVMVPKEHTNDIMDRLYELGARAILVTAIHAARL